MGEQAEGDEGSTSGGGLKVCVLKAGEWYVARCYGYGCSGEVTGILRVQVPGDGDGVPLGYHKRARLSGLRAPR